MRSHAATSMSPFAGQTARKSVWDGVYTEEQAERGQRTYTRVCSYCKRYCTILGSVGA